MRARRKRPDRCASCGGSDLVDAIDNHGRPYRGCARCRVLRSPTVSAEWLRNLADLVECGEVTVIRCDVRPRGVLFGIVAPAVAEKVEAQR